MDVHREVSRETSRAIYDDAFTALEDSDHPCHHFKDLQTNVPESWRWQLPIPFMGRHARQGLVFMGLNPSFGVGDDPTIDNTFQEYDGYWRSYFEDHPVSLPRLYLRYIDIGKRAIDGFRIGEDALAVELIRFRSARGEGLFEDGPPFRVFQHERKLTMRGLEEVRAKVILCCGAEAFWGIGELFPGLTQQLRSPTRIKQEEARIYYVDAPWGRTAVVPSRHLMGAIPSPTADDRQRIALSIREALAELS